MEPGTPNFEMLQWLTTVQTVFEKSTCTNLCFYNESFVWLQYSFGTSVQIQTVSK